MTENITGYGWKLQVGAATGDSLPSEGAEVWADVADIEDLTPPAPSRSTQEWFVLGLKASKKRVGSISYTSCTGTLTRAYDEEPHDRLEDDSMGIVGGVNTGATPRRNYRIIKNNAGQERRFWAGYCTKFASQSVTNQDREKIDLEIVVDGDVTVVR